MSTDTASDGENQEFSSDVERHISSPGTETIAEQADRDGLSSVHGAAVHAAIESSAKAVLEVLPGSGVHSDGNETISTLTASNVSPKMTNMNEGRSTAANDVHGESTTIWSSSNNATAMHHSDAIPIDHSALHPLRVDDSDADTLQRGGSEKMPAASRTIGAGLTDDEKLRDDVDVVTDSETTTSAYAELSEPVRKLLSEVKLMTKAEQAQADSASKRPRSHLADPLTATPKDSAMLRKVRSSHGSPTGAFTSDQRKRDAESESQSDSDSAAIPPPPIAIDDVVARYDTAQTTEEDERELATIFRDEEPLSTNRSGNEDLDLVPLSAIPAEYDNEGETERIHAATRRRLADLLAERVDRVVHGDTTKPKSKRAVETVSEGDGDDDDGTEISVASFLSEDSVAQRVRRVLAETAHLAAATATETESDHPLPTDRDILSAIETGRSSHRSKPKSKKYDYTTVYYESMLRDLEEIQSRISKPSAANRPAAAAVSVNTSNVSKNGDRVLKWDHGGDLAVHRVIAGSREHESFICSPDDTEDLERQREQPVSERKNVSVEALRILEEAERAESRLRELQARRKLKADYGLSDVQQRAAAAIAVSRRRTGGDSNTERLESTRSTETQTEQAANAAADYLADLLRAQIDRSRGSTPSGSRPPVPWQYSSASALYNPGRAVSASASVTALHPLRGGDEESNANAAWRTESISADVTPLKPRSVAQPSRERERDRERDRASARTFDAERTQSQPSLARQHAGSTGPEYDYLRELETSGLLHNNSKFRMNSAESEAAKAQLRIPLEPAADPASLVNTDRTDKQNVRFESVSATGLAARAEMPAASAQPQVQQSVPSTARSVTTLDSTHPGSDDAQAPPFSPLVLGSRSDPAVAATGVYGSRSPPRRISPVRELTERETAPVAKAQPTVVADQFERAARNLTTQSAERSKAMSKQKPKRSAREDKSRPTPSINSSDLQSVWDRFDSLYRERGTLTTDRLREFESLLRDPLHAAHIEQQRRPIERPPPIVIDSDTDRGNRSEIVTGRTAASVSTVDTGELVTRLADRFGDDGQLSSVPERERDRDRMTDSAASPKRRAKASSKYRENDLKAAMNSIEFDAKVNKLASIIAKYEKKAANDRRRQQRHEQMAMQLNELLSNRDRLLSLDPNELSDMDTASTATFVVDDDISVDVAPVKTMKTNRLRAAKTQTGDDDDAEESDASTIVDEEDTEFESDRRAPLGTANPNVAKSTRAKVDRGISADENMPITLRDAAKAGYRVIRARPRTEKPVDAYEDESTARRASEREKSCGSERGSGSDVQVDRLSLRSDVLQRWKNDAEKLGRSRLRVDLAPARNVATEKAPAPLATRSASEKLLHARKNMKENENPQPAPALTAKSQEPDFVSTDRSRFLNFPIGSGSDLNAASSARRSLNAVTPRDEFISSQRDAAASARPSGISWYVSLPSYRETRTRSRTAPSGSSNESLRKLNAVANDSQRVSEREAITSRTAVDTEPTSSSRRVTAFATQPDVQLYYAPKDSYRFGAPLGDENVPPRERTLAEAFQHWRGSRTFKSHLNARQRRIRLATDERSYETRLQAERDRIFDIGGRRNRNTTVIDPLADNLYNPKKRSLTLREMRDHTERVYRTLPEVRNRILSECREAQYRTNRLKAQLFKQKLLRDVLEKKSKWASISVY